MKKCASHIMCALGVMLLFAGTAAAQDAAGITPTKLEFANRQVLSVDATSLELKIGEIPPREYPHVNYRSHIRFEDGAREWAGQHFKLTGESVNTLRITIRKGDIVEKLLPVKKGIKGWFTKDQSAEYEATLDLEIAIVNPNGQVLTSAQGKASTTRTVPEGTTDADKQQVWTGLIIATFDNLDNELQPQLRSVMGQYIR
ncbi:MAG: hypothetical protein K2P94_11455 [Rhodospirillaceae bacterium]|nr:hypothetical protein [Rhodospirillaceae bacterium]